MQRDGAQSGEEKDKAGACGDEAESIEPEGEVEEGHHSRRQDREQAAVRRFLPGLMEESV